MATTDSPPADPPAGRGDGYKDGRDEEKWECGKCYRAVTEDDDMWCECGGNWEPTDPAAKRFMRNYIEEQKKVADLTAERDAARAEVARLTSELADERRYHSEHDARDQSQRDVIQILRSELAARGGPDDGEPVTEEWLESIGFEDDDRGTEGVDYLWINNREDGLFDLQYHRKGSTEYATPNLWVVADGENSIILPSPKTRGQVRRLLLALGLTPDSGDPGPDEVRAKFVADVRTHLRCNCAENGYEGRSRTYHGCPWHAYAIELLTDEEFSGDPATTTEGG